MFFIWLMKTTLVLCCAYMYFSCADASCNQVKQVIWNEFVSANLTCNGSEKVKSLEACVKLCLLYQACLGFVYKQSYIDSDVSVCSFCGSNPTGKAPAMWWKTDFEFYITNKDKNLYQQAFKKIGVKDDFFSSCQEIKSIFKSEAGVYKIYKNHDINLVYCNMSLTNVSSDCDVSLESNEVKFSPLYIIGELKYMILYKSHVKIEP